MDICKNFEKCSFVKEFEKDESRSLALKGFINMYCKGDKQDECIRKKVSKALGGPEHVPNNMMPNGKPLTGTTSDDWSDEVKSLI